MERSIIQLAKSTLVVSLPKKWLEKQDLHKGDKVQLEEKEDRLTIRSKGKKNSSITINLKKGQVFTTRHVADLYIRGYDEVIITFNDEPIVQKIMKEDLLGFEIVERSKNRVVIKNVADNIETEFDSMLRRAFILVKEMGTMISKEKIDPATLDELLSLEDMVNKFTSFCKRVLNKQGYNPSYKTPFLYVFTKDLEVLGDIYKYMAKDITTYSKKELAFIYLANTYVEQLYALFYTYNEEIVKEMRDTKNLLLSKGRKMVKEGSLVGHYGLELVLVVTSMKGPIITMNFKQ